MQQAAYDFQTFERTRPSREAQRARTPLRAVPGGKKRRSPLQALLSNVGHILAMGLVVGLALSLIQSKVVINETTNAILRTEKELLEAQSQYSYLSGELNSKASMANVEEIAARLGLMRLDDSQITYVRLEDSSVLIRPESTVKKWTDFLHAGALTMMGYLG